MTELSDLSETDASNSAITGANIAEGCNPSDINNAIRNLAGLLKRWFKTSLFRLRDGTDQTKLLAIDLSSLTTGTTRTLTVADANGTILTSASFASVATVVAATDLSQPVSSGRIANHPGVAKCWVHCGVAGNIFASYGVSSVTDNGAGDLSVTQSVTFGSNVGAIQATPYAPGAIRSISVYGYTTTRFDLNCYNPTSGVAADPSEWFAERKGTLA